MDSATRETTIWWGDGKWRTDLGSCIVACGRMTLLAEISTKYKSAPKAENEVVSSVRLVFTDSELAGKQWEWRQKMSDFKKEKKLKF